MLIGHDHRAGERDPVERGDGLRAVGHVVGDAVAGPHAGADQRPRDPPRGRRQLAVAQPLVREDERVPLGRGRRRAQQEVADRGGLGPLGSHAHKPNDRLVNCLCLCACARCEPTFVRGARRPRSATCCCKAAAATPEADAVVFPDERLSYAELRGARPRAGRRADRPRRRARRPRRRADGQQPGRDRLDLRHRARGRGDRPDQHPLSRRRAAVRGRRRGREGDPHERPHRRLRRPARAAAARRCPAAERPTARAALDGAGCAPSSCSARRAARARSPRPSSSRSQAPDEELEFRRSGARVRDDALLLYTSGHDLAAARLPAHARGDRAQLVDGRADPAARRRRPHVGAVPALPPRRDRPAARVRVGAARRS